MIHPDTELCSINKEKGRGIFATSFIPKGTLTYVEDPLEIEIPPDDPRLDDPRISQIIETYSYIKEDGSRIISWDNAKYMNHCCHCNTMSTGYGFEIAISDIEAGEEITDEYGLFNFDDTLELHCQRSDCRGKVNGDDIDEYHKQWDQKVQSALRHFDAVHQPLELFIDREILKKIHRYLRTGEGYISVLNLKLREENKPSSTS